ncbi:MAG: hypothetical protein NTZ05_00790, partial [Chloroflexi bacterium]|nr:hypothetical protein [Chloroflexota bacterium]
KLALAGILAFGGGSAMAPGAAPAGAGLAATIGGALAPTTVFAGMQDFTLTNNLGLTITHIYVESSANSSWGGDVLGRDTLAVGEATNITFDGYADTECMFDIRIVVQGDQQWDVMGVNLCELHNITFSMQDGAVVYALTNV